VAAALLPTAFALVSTGVAAALMHQALNQTPTASTGQVSAQASFTGAVSGDTEGTITIHGGVGGPCSSRARQANGLVFSKNESSDGGKKALTVIVSLPPGRQGPGTYDLKETPLVLHASYAFSPDQAGSQAGERHQGQVWKIQPGTTTAVLVIRPDASGNLTVSGLRPSAPQPAGSSLGEPLNFTLSFFCR
jgi:hypothetical protein